MDRVEPLLIELPAEILTPRLRLVPPAPGDGLSVNRAIAESFPELNRWMDWASTMPTIIESERFVRDSAARFMRREDLPLFFRKRDTGEFVGASGLHRIDWQVPRFEIGYWCRTSMVGKGYVSEAVVAITRFAFEKLGAARVETAYRQPQRAQLSRGGAAGLQAGRHHAPRRAHAAGHVARYAFVFDGRPHRPAQPLNVAATPVVQTKRLRLRRYSESDAHLLIDSAWRCRDDAALAGAAHDGAGARLASARIGCVRSTAGLGRMAIELADGTYIGDAGIVRAQILDRTENDLGYIIDKGFWRSGYGFEAALACFEYGRGHGQQRIVANMAADNLGSVRVAQRLGFTLEQRFRNTRNRDKETLLYAWNAA